MIRAVGLSVLSVALIASCADKPDKTPAQEFAAPYPIIQVAEVAGRDERWLDGRVEGVNQALVTAQTSGEIVEVVRDVADRASRGQVVIRLRSIQQQAGLAQAEAALNEAKARSAEASARAARIKTLFERKAIPKATLDEAVAAHESALARLEAARGAVSAAREGLSYTTISAPFDGVITDRFVNPGAIVAPGMPVFGIAGVDRLRVTTDLPERFAAAVRSRREVDVLIGDRRIRALEVIVQPRTVEGSGSVGLRADLPKDTEGVQPGMVVRLAVATRDTRPLRLPLSSIVERGELTGAYVFDPKLGRTSFRQLRLGRRFGDEVDVLAGLVSGEKVASDPVAALRHLSAVRDHK